MPQRSHLIAVARELKQRLIHEHRTFLTLSRYEITELVRVKSGEPTTRIKSNLAAELTAALNTQGVLVFPDLWETTTGDVVRIHLAGTLFGSLVEAITHPDVSDDRYLGEVIRKVKGEWDWPAEAS